MRKPSPLIVTCLVLIAGAGVRASAATWTSPSQALPGGNVAPSVHTNTLPQTKQGGLTIGDNKTLTAVGNPNALVLGLDETERVLFCLNGTDAASCRSGWDEFEGPDYKLRLSPEGQDLGFVYLEAPGNNFADQNEVASTIRGTAGRPTSLLSTAGVYGEASSSLTEGKSYGIYADLKGVSTHSAIIADTYLGVDRLNRKLFGGWAGYFNGSVAISNTKGGTCKNNAVPCTSDAMCASGDTCIPFPSLIIGNTALPNSSLPKDKGYICLDGDCRSAWPTLTGWPNDPNRTAFWNCTTNPCDLKPNVSTRSLALAGSGQFAGMSVKVTPDDVGTPLKADVNLRGTATFIESYTVGTAPADLPVGMTCGNRICEGLENDTFASPYYCPQDCDVTPPGEVNVETLFYSRCFGSLCPARPPMFYLYWTNPSDPDLAGIRVIISDDPARIPDEYTDPSYGSIYGGDLPPTTDSVVQACQNDGDAYYVGLFTYDTDKRNFSRGVTTTVVCSDDEVTFGGGDGYIEN